MTESYLPLLLSVIRSPTDMDIRLVFADYLDEQGSCGEAMRWAARRKKRPAKIRGVRGGRMWSLESIGNRAHMVVPTSLWEEMKAIDSSRRIVEVLHWQASHSMARYPSEIVAWEVFIEAFGNLHQQGKIGRRKGQKKYQPFVAEQPSLFSGVE